MECITIFKVMGSNVLYTTEIEDLYTATAKQILGIYCEDQYVRFRRDVPVGVPLDRRE